MDCKSNIFYLQSSYTWFIPFFPLSLLNQNFCIFGIIMHCHRPSSELHSNCILLGEELSSYLRNASLHYHVLFFSQRYSMCFELKPSQSFSSLWVFILRTRNEMSWIREHKYLVQWAIFKAKLWNYKNPVAPAKYQRLSVWRTFSLEFSYCLGKRNPNMRNICRMLLIQKLE